MLRIARYPLVTSAVCVLAAFIVVDGVRRTVDPHMRHNAWALAAFIAIMIYGIALYFVAASARGRQRLGFRGERVSAVPVVLLAIAWAQILVSVGAVLLGAATWCLWIGFGIFCVLIGLWYYQQRRTSAT
jgi:hypothetical protein